MCALSAKIPDAGTRECAVPKISLQSCGSLHRTSSLTSLACGAAGDGSAEAASMVPGMVSTPAAGPSAVTPALPKASPGPPPVWPHTVQRYVPPQGDLSRPLCPAPCLWYPAMLRRAFLVLWHAVWPY